jgi:hypothetical protein
MSACFPSPRSLRARVAAASLRGAVLASAALVAAACASRVPVHAPSAPPEPAPVLEPGLEPGPEPALEREPPPLARFTVLFRRADDAPLTVRTRTGVLGDDGAAAPVEPALLDATLDQAAEAWSASGVVDVRRIADAVQPAELLVTFARGEHGDCPAFGRDRGAAHVWPPGAPVEIHLDAGRPWVRERVPERRSPNEPLAHSLVATLVHELGHALGLGHTPDTDAALFGDSRRLTPGRSDLAGIRSLYGAAGETDAAGPDDVVIEAASGARVRLVDVAPAGVSTAALADTDGDGRAELLVARSDPAGHGIVLVYRFDEELRLVATLGPLVGALIPGADLELVRLDTGLVLRSRLGDELLARAFDADGLPGLPLPIDPELEDAPALGDLARGDVDGDGRVDRIAHGPESR